MELNPDKIYRLAKEKEDENWDFRSFLKGCNDLTIDSIVHDLVKRVTSKIDCTKCGNCCVNIHPTLDNKDIKKMSKSLSISPESFNKEYVRIDRKGQYILNQTPCPFLKNKKCTHYEARPSDCVSYPHLHKKEFIFRLMGVIDNTFICPIVFNVYEALKKELRSDFDDYLDQIEDYW